MADKKDNIVKDAVVGTKSPTDQVLPKEEMPVVEQPNPEAVESLEHLETVPQVVAGETDAARRLREAREAKVAIPNMQARERAERVEAAENGSPQNITSVREAEVEHLRQQVENTDLELEALILLRKRQNQQLEEAARVGGVSADGANVKRKKGVRYIEVRTGYRGRTTNEQYIAPGVYALDDATLFGQGEFLIKSKRAAWARKPEPVTAEVDFDEDGFED